MEKKKFKITLSCITLLLLSSGTYAYTTAQNHQENNYKPQVSTTQQSQNLVALDTVIDKKSVPVKPVEDGKVNDEFVNRFDNAVSLNDKTGQFEINKSKIPDNASEDEISSLNNMVDKSNESLKKIIASTPKENTVQTGDSVVVANDEKTAKEEAKESQISTMGKYHNGSTYLHVYWWGLRIGINKAQTQYAASAGLVIAGVYVPARAAQAALGVLGLSVGKFIPGGIVFNSSPQFIPIAGSNAIVWGVGWQ
ncbi:hypothetical protein VNN28_06275 [Lactococcus formosensis]|jgi:hypothetical protein|uniref:hypothetical protein n=1 Tax=Lactococcus formosensis TaxID=1281486 RepID=UPI0030CFFFB8